MEHHIFLPQQLFQLLEQGGVEQAPGPQPALGVGQIEHGGLLAGEEDKEVALAEVDFASMAEETEKE